MIRMCASARSVRPEAYGVGVPQWIIMMVLAIVAWLVVSIGGGLIVGRLIRVASRRRGVA
jgi:hypothetical protein